MSRDGKRRRGLSYEERVLWTTVTKAIKPLRAKPPVAPDEDSDAAADIFKRPAKAGAKPAAAAPRKPRAGRRRRQAWRRRPRRLAAA